MNDIFAIMFHYVRNIECGRYKGLKGLEIEEFEEQIKFLRENFYILTMEELLDMLSKYQEGEDTAPLLKRAVLLTFDDGYADHFTNVYPVLDKYNIQGTFFVNSLPIYEGKMLNVNKIQLILSECPDVTELKDMTIERLNKLYTLFDIPSSGELWRKWASPSRYDDENVVFIKRVMQVGLPQNVAQLLIDDLFQEIVAVDESVLAKEYYLSLDQIKTMKKNGMFFGIHGHSHCWMGKMEELSEIEKEIQMCVALYKEVIDETGWVLNYPYGNYSEKVIQVAQENGCIAGFSTELSKMDFSKRYILPRLDTNDFPPKSRNYLNYL